MTSQSTVQQKARTFTHHPIAIVLMATLPIQLILVALGICRINSGETAVVAFFFIEGLIMLRPRLSYDEKGISIASAFKKEQTIAWSDITSCEIDNKKGIIGLRLKVKNMTKSVVLPPTLDLYRHLEAAGIKTPKVKSIKSFVSKVQPFAKFVLFEIVLILIIWAADARDSGWGTLSIILLVVSLAAFVGLVFLTTTRISCDDELVRVKGFFRTPKSAYIDQIVSAEHFEIAHFACTKLTCAYKTLIVTPDILDSSFDFLVLLVELQGKKRKPKA